MNTKRQFAWTGKKVERFSGWFSGILVVLLLSWGVGFAGTFVPYDDFSVSPAVINNTKWGQYETVREITEGKLRLKARSSRNSTSRVDNNLNILSPATVNTIEADMTLHAYDNMEGTEVRLRLLKFLYNDGTSETGNVGDVGAHISMGGTAQSPVVYFHVFRNTTEDFQWEAVYGHNFSTVPVLDTPYSASLSWNGTTITGTFNGESFTYTPETTINPVHNPYCVLQTQVNPYANGVGIEATVEGFFDNVRVNGALYDDFSSSVIDETKWYNYYFEFVREIDTGKLRSEVRSTAASTVTIQSALTMLAPQSAKAIEAKVRLTSYDNPSAARPRARVFGSFFNDGSTGGGYTGDYLAFAYLGGNGTSPVAGWVVARYSGTGSDSAPGVASGTFTTPISLGVDYTLSVDWDGSKFVFKIDSETVEYAPVVSTILPANQPVKGLDTVIQNNSGKEATIAALFDDVRIVEPPLYADFGSTGIWMYNGDTWSQLTPYSPSAMVASGSLLYGKYDNGIWQYSGSTWSQLTPYSPSAMVASGSLLYGKYDNGIWQYSGSTWSQLTPYSPSAMVASGSLLYGKYDNGIWQYSGSTWSQLTPYSPSAMVASGSLLYGKYDNGIWIYNGSAWSQLTPYSPTDMVASGSLLYGKYDNGIWMYNGSTWSQVTPNNPSAMVASGTLLYADFGSTGIWMYNGSTWSQITPNDPTTMIVP